MNRQSLLSSLLALCLLVCSSLAQQCDWDLSVAPNQGLNLEAPGIKMLPLTRAANSPESCKAACCDEPRCDLALVGYPADGEAQCMLVSCMRDGRDMCVLQRSDQFTVYRRSEKTKARGEAEDSGEKLHIVPLQDSGEPRTNSEDNNSAVLPDDSTPPPMTTSFDKDVPEDAESPAEPEPAATESANTQETEMAADEYADYCQVGPQAGPCRAALKHWYYNSETKNCETFIYGGCRGNKNNYISKESCVAMCTVSVLPSARKSSSDADENKAEPEPAATESANTPETGMTADEYADYCQVGPQAGPCRAALKHWYYNSKTKNCETFIYGGCRGNKNNYISKESCVAMCTVSVLPSSKKSSSEEIEHRDQCMVSPEPGPCRAAFNSFYYDHKTDSCRSFIYGGCKGNQNRYNTMEECMSRCSGTGSFDSRAKRPNHWTPVFFLLITLAAISALLLVTLVLISMRRHRLPHRASSISDKEELLPETYEQLSVESLSIPGSPTPDKA